MKYDGFCVPAGKLGERAKISSRRGADFTDRFSGIAEAVRGLSADRALIDGGAIRAAGRRAERLRHARRLEREQRQVVSNATILHGSRNSMRS